MLCACALCTSYLSKNSGYECLGNWNSIPHTKNQLFTLKNKKSWKTVQNVHCAVVVGQIWQCHSNCLLKRSLYWKFQKNWSKNKENVCKYPHQLFLSIAPYKSAKTSKKRAKIFQKQQKESYNFFCVCALHRKKKKSIIKIACLMLYFLNLKSKASHFFWVASSLAY